MSKVLEDMLQQLASEEARLLLVDMKDPEKRTPQFYQAVHRVLERYKFNISKVQPDEGILGDLAAAIPVTTDDDLYTH
ncbi:MAG: hypothetical protein ACRDCE_20385 [Cetobacterium sp.]|uniref:hypothetical protein n=1 Tax=Cetobacterium sp. TaxID=2071632 RepID=UPI003EE47EE7